MSRSVSIDSDKNQTSEEQEVGCCLKFWKNRMQDAFCCCGHPKTCCCGFKDLCRGFVILAVISFLFRVIGLIVVIAHAPSGLGIAYVISDSCFGLLDIIHIFGAIKENAYIMSKVWLCRLINMILNLLLCAVVSYDMVMHKLFGKTEKAWDSKNITIMICLTFLMIPLHIYIWLISHSYAQQLKAEQEAETMTSQTVKPKPYQSNGKIEPTS